jgi:hypothetical protein
MTELKCPSGLDEIVATFGNPQSYLRSDGTLSPSWERKQIVRVELPAPLKLDFVEGDDEPFVTKITAHRLIAPLLSACLAEVFSAGLWDQLVGYSGGFAWRPIRGKRRVSTHAWGIAWDFGASRDPLGDKPGGDDPDMPLEIVNIFRKHGFVWGGDWARADQMHFQFAENY